MRDLSIAAGLDRKISTGRFAHREAGRVVDRYSSAYIQPLQDNVVRTVDGDVAIDARARRSHDGHAGIGRCHRDIAADRPGHQDHIAGPQHIRIQNVLNAVAGRVAGRANVVGRADVVQVRLQINGRSYALDVGPHGKRMAAAVNGDMHSFRQTGGGTDAG